MLIIRRVIFKFVYNLNLNKEIYSPSPVSFGFCAQKSSSEQKKRKTKTEANSCGKCNLKWQLSRYESKTEGEKGKSNAMNIEMTSPSCYWCWCWCNRLILDLELCEAAES